LPEQPTGGRLDRYLDEVVASGASTALAVAVTDGEETVLVRTRGEVEERSLFEIGSIGKSFTAILTLQLVDEGLLSLDAPVAEYLPWFSVHSGHRPITLHDLLTHTSGVIRGAEVATASNFDVAALAETETGFAPGEHFWYSNVGYRALGLVLEAVSRSLYPELVRARILEPLELEDATPSIVHDTRRRLAPLAMPFYDDRPWRAEHGLVPATWIESAEADGCICCSAPALARYLAALMAHDGRLLPPERFATLLTDHVEDDQDRGRYGYGIAFVDGGFGHGGGMVGHFATMWSRPDRGRGVVVLANGVAPTDRIADAVFAEIGRAHV